MEDKKKQKKVFNKKLITQVIAIILFLVILILSLITLSSTVKASNLAFGKYSFFIMKSTNQPYVANRGDLVITRKLKSGEVQAGDNIVFGDGRIYFCDSVVQTRRINTITKMIIAEYDGIKYQFSEDEIQGKVVYKINDLGDIITFLRTPIGSVFYIIIVICIFILLRITILRPKDKEKDTEEKKQENIEEKTTQNTEER